MDKKNNKISETKTLKGFVSFDENQKIKEIDQNACEILQVSYQEVKRQPIQALLPNFDTNLKNSILDHIKSQNESEPFDLVYHDPKSDLLKRLEIAYANIRDIDNEVLGSILMIRRTVISKNITFPKTSISGDSSEIPNHPELSSFYQMLVHELKKPLQTIKSYAVDVLSDTDDVPEKVVERVNQIGNQSTRLQNVLKDLVKLMKVSDTPINLEFVDISHLCRNVFNDLCRKTPYRKATLKIEDNLILQGDKGLINILFTNLIQNAWKFTVDKKQTEITIGKKVFGDYIYFYVKDNGSGFDASNSEKLFAPFAKFESNNGEATGLGLSIVKQIVALHGGKIWAKGEPNKGASFYFTLGEKVTSKSKETQEIQKPEEIST